MASAPPIPPELSARLAHPTIRLSGAVDDMAVASFLTQLGPVLEVEGAIVLELFTSGGDADVGLRLAEEIRQLREVQGRDLWFLGKTLVASAGVTVMSAFPRNRRWLTRDTTLLVHGRRIRRKVRLEGPLGSCRRVLQEMIADIDNGLRVEERGLAALVEGSDLTLEAVRDLAYGGWYVSAEQALETRLVEGLV